jgi:hypothetical protein
MSLDTPFMTQNSVLEVSVENFPPVSCVEPDSHSEYTIYQYFIIFILFY